METDLSVIFLSYYLLLVASVGLACAAAVLHKRYKELTKLQQRILKLLAARTRKL